MSQYVVQLEKNAGLVSDKAVTDQRRETKIVWKLCTMSIINHVGCDKHPLGQGAGTHVSRKIVKITATCGAFTCTRLLDT